MSPSRSIPRPARCGGRSQTVDGLDTPAVFAPRFAETAEGAFAAWTIPGEDSAALHTIDAGGSQALQGDETIDDNPLVQAVSDDGYIWVLSDDEETSFAIDRTGAARSEAVAGRLLAAHEGTLVAIADDVIRLHRYS